MMYGVMDKWTREQIIIAYRLYCETPFGQIHSRNPQIIDVANILERSPNALAMKMSNLASFDSLIIQSGRKGLKNASKLDKKIVEEFEGDWEKLFDLSEEIISNMAFSKPFENLKDMSEYEEGFPRVTEQERIVKTRRNQDFFRKSILSNYSSKCCITGLSDKRLLIASHIVPWHRDEKNRLNPRNGVCLSVLHDKAFDQGLITILPDWRIRVAATLRKNTSSAFLSSSILSLEGQRINLPEKFAPDSTFLEYHNNNIFLD